MTEPLKLLFQYKIILNPNGIMQMMTTIKTKKQRWLASSTAAYELRVFPSQKLNVLNVKCEIKFKEGKCSLKKIFIFSLFFHFSCHNHSSRFSSLFPSPHLAQGSIHHSPHLCHKWLMHVFDGSQLQNSYIKNEDVLHRSASHLLLSVFCLHKQSTTRLLSFACITLYSLSWQTGQPC